MTSHPDAPAPNNDDLVRAAAWLDDQADEADAVARTFTDNYVPTTEGTLTRQTAVWLRNQASEAGITKEAP